jgi:ABC-type lipoprotein export system ATPase subunit
MITLRHERAREGQGRRHDDRRSRAETCGVERKTLAEKPRGLVLVTGPTGSGKSTTLAAMIDEINAERDEHILTIEDPIEFLHRTRTASSTSARSAPTRQTSRTR